MRNRSEVPPSGPNTREVDLPQLSPWTLACARCWAPTSTPTAPPPRARSVLAAARPRCPLNPQGGAAGPPRVAH
eukprot:scaffold75689_cov30-Phaeocystis_antarctica.AAC.1